MTSAPVTIAGGGIAGLAVALALGERDLQILEQAEAYSNVGASLQLGPNAVRALQKLGAWDAVEPATSSPAAIHLYDGVTGKRLKHLSLGQGFERRFGAPYRVAQRADLHAALLSCVRARPNITIRHSCRVSSARQRDDAVELNVNGSTETAAALIAADGVSSAIRQSIFPQTSAQRSGAVFHRAEVDLMAIPGIDLACVNVWLYPRGHVVMYPAGTTQRLNIVAITPEGQTPQSFFAHGTGALQHVVLHFDPNTTPWSGLYVEPLRRWTEGNTLLIGDAAHGTLPYLAQGAAMALEDAAELQTQLLGAVALNDAFSQTAERRQARTVKLHGSSLAAGTIYHHNGVMRFARNAVLRASPPNMLSRRMAWIYRG